MLFQRKRFRLAASLAAALLATVPAGAADSEQPRFQHLGQRDGLSQAVVYTIAQDRTGYMWFGTQEGLNRFDGYEFVVFGPDDNNPGSLRNESIRALTVSSDGTLWVATDAGGLSRYDSATESFLTYMHDPADAGSLADNRVRAIFEDSRGRLWIGTDGSGLDLLDRDTSVFSHFRHDPADMSSLSGNHVWSIVEDSDGSIWVATTEGLNRLDPDTGKFERFQHNPDDDASLSHDEVRVAYMDRQRNLWIGTAEGLNRYDRSTNSFERFMSVEADPGSLSANRINTILQDETGVLWIGTVSGLNAWQPRSRSFTRYRKDIADPYSLPHDTVFSLYQDRAGVLWVGSYDGLSRWNPATRAMRHYRTVPDDATSLSNNTITSFTEDPAGNILVGTFGGGINVLDRTRDEFSQVQNDPLNDASLSGDRVMALLYDSKGRLWAGTRASGLNRRDTQTGDFVRYVHDPDDDRSISANGVTYLLEDRNGGIWAATFGGGLNYYDGSGFRHFRHDPDDPTSLSSDRILVLYEDAAGGIWVGTYASGLNYLDPVTGRFTRYRANPDDPMSLRDDGITMITEDASGDLWIGVKGSGLGRWRREEREAGRAVFEHFSEINGLPSGTIYSGQWDSAGHLWLSTGRGLSRLTPRTMSVRNFDMSHGLQGDEFNLAAGFRAENGEMFFGGMNGFNAFQPAAINGNGLAPRVTITDFLLFNQPFDIADSRRTGAPVRLGHDQDVISFEFAALDFAAPEKTVYEYQLEGVDEDWIQAGTRRQVTYSNLPAGDYTFRVRATNNDGIRSEQAAILPLSVSAAPWATWWAWLLYVGILALAVLYAIRSQSRRARQKAMVRHAEEVHRLQGRLANAQQIANVGNWELNLENDRLWWSDQVYRLLRLVPEKVELSYAGFLERVHPEDRSRVDDAVQGAITDGEPFSLDHRVVWPDGGVRFVHERGEVITDKRGRPIRVAATMHDISDRRAAEDALREQAGFQEMLATLSRALLQASPDDVDDVINDGLEAIGLRYALDEVAVSWFSADQNQLSTLNNWTRVNGSHRGNGLASRHIPWTIAKLLASEDVVIDDITDFPVADARDESTYRRRGIQSLLVVPLKMDATLSGACQFITRGKKREWPDDVVAELRLLSEVIASAIARQNALSEVTRLKDELQAENLYLREEVKIAHGFDGIIGEDPALRRCLAAVEKVAPTDVPVLVLGETGTGKELIARAIHKLSPRADGPMISVNCPALPGNLIESELFGHEKGSFTGADAQRKGRFEIAEGGTIFLDEIGELPIDLQAKLLRVLQTGEFERIGGTKTLHTNVRLVAATNRNLPERIKEGEFRSDLYFRINSFPIYLPPLRERTGDIPALAEHFVHKHAKRLNRDVTAISAKFLKQLEEYHWPGNVRELEGTIERALISSTDGDVLALDEPLTGLRPTGGGFVELSIRENADLADMERTYILAVLEKTNWRVAGTDGAAGLLGMPASTLRSKMKKLGIDRE